jgi:hypothetical protein
MRVDSPGAIGESAGIERGILAVSVVIRGSDRDSLTASHSSDPPPPSQVSSNP